MARHLAWIAIVLALLLLGMSAAERALAAPPTPEQQAAIEKAKAFIAAAERPHGAPSDPVDRGGLLGLFAPAAPAPVVEPYKVPALDGGAVAHRRAAQPLRLGRGIDSDGLFAAVAQCYPGGSMWQPEVELTARAQSGGTTVDATGLAIADHYIGIVARLPLYSAGERTRQRDREYQRRTATAELVGTLGRAVAERGRALREYGLYRALESRAAERVALGLVDTAEQVTYLQSVAASHASAVTAHATIEQTRLALVGQCRPEAAGRIDSYIKAATALETSAEAGILMHAAAGATQ